METKEAKDGGKEEEKGCCGKGRGCCGKALAAVVLLAVGATGGYFAGRCCTLKHATPAAVTAPAPAK